MKKFIATILTSLSFFMVVTGAQAARLAQVESCESRNGTCVSSLQDCPLNSSSAGQSTCESGQKCCIQLIGSTSGPSTNLSPPTTEAATSTGGAATIQDQQVQRGSFGLINPFGSRGVPQIIGDLIRWLGGLAGSLFFLYLLWGGFEWMLAGGNDQRVKSGRQKIIYSVVGIVIILLSYIMVDALIGLVNIRF